ncbi:MAG: tyrosine-type recombinase/integrase [Gammaproteobacteria bacterium]|jgi:integrase|nr:tyrosine-type recombinase/integrase [Gammaproteobacteria bacterium]MBT3722570.1 tyrosine-type recombinase/integrase [Gammaproteobacteria bacterium]MBT4078688.1 tyrosine-type recombinase/integrase [Gammaproteobacteria bacterium]MBT4196999.1 tyrosine-type recombinase/integrase [Gammaproteobacteria bacterium]MBT4451854.1 tyrosine-type recombinase/integrase [Gammaproteobacteria bacterium]
MNELSGKLSAVQVKQAKSKSRPYKLTDGKGLNLEIRPNGSKYWRLSYRYQQKQKTLALGVYPVVTLAQARSKSLNAKRMIQDGDDPAIIKRQEKALKVKSTFLPIAEEWHEKESGRWSKDHAERVWWTIKADALPYLGDMPINDIKTRDVLHVVKMIEDRGALDVASRVKQRISSVFRYAIQTGYTEQNPVDALKDVIRTRKVQHRKSLKFEELPVFLNELDNYPGYLLTRYALQLIVYTFVRPGELRSAEWKDIDLEKAVWRIPAEKMKMNEEHIVPLSKQAIVLLGKIHQLSGSYDLVFPGSHNYRKLMSENTLTYAIRKRLGFDATAHGFRTTASTILNESGFRVDVIERQLAHGERNKVRAAYNRSQYLAERTDMMQWYSDYLDGLKVGSNVVPINKAVNN